MTPTIIAEAGINHGGSLTKAMDYILAAEDAGAEYVKFHMAYADRMINIEEKRILWDDAHPVSEEPIDKFVSRVELSVDEVKRLKDFTNGLNIDLMVSCYDEKSIHDALDLGIKAIKLASCDFVRESFVKILNARADHVFLATGMVDYDELIYAKRYINNAKTHVLHCVSLYPSPYDLLNLNFMKTLRDFGWNVGYSDHTKGIGASVVALSQEPTAIEKHFMLDSDAGCADEKVSCSPRELKELVVISKKYNQIFGSTDRSMSPEEYNNREKFRNRW